MKLKDIASRIRAHLRRFEADPKINTTRPEPYGGVPYFGAGAYSAGRFVYVKYINYQGSSYLTKDEATRYLAWLDAGNIGRHYEAFREAAS